MERTRLINYRGLISTPDMAQALRTLETKASENDWKVAVSAGPSPMSQAGREVLIQLKRKDRTPLEALHAAWGFAIPLGFTPWARWPVIEGDPDIRFHFLGPWQVVGDNLLAEGRGHLAWTSMQAAALVDVGRWEGSHQTERYIQAQLHRVGKNPGPIDGIIGPRTTGQIHTLALGRSSLDDLVEALTEMEPPQPRVSEIGSGHIFVHGREVVIQGAGGVKVQKRPGGALLAISGPGRVVVDIGDLA